MTSWKKRWPTSRARHGLGVGTIFRRRLSDAERMPEPIETIGGSYVTKTKTARPCRAATTAVVAGTAGAVSHHQQQKYAGQEAAAQQQQDAAYQQGVADAQAQQQLYRAAARLRPPPRRPLPLPRLT